MEKKSRRILNEMTMKLRSHSKKEQLVSPPANIQTLPEEVLIEIFSYLSLGELCNTVSKVCTQWERLHWDRQLYSLPRIPEIQGTVEDLFECLDEEPSLASPYFEDIFIKEIISKCLNTCQEVKHRTAEWTELLMILCHLRKVQLFGESKDLWSTSKKVALFLKCCVQLEELVCCNNKFRIRSAELISICDQLCGTLRALHLKHCQWTAEATRALTKCHLLEDLAIIEGYSISEVCLLEVANMASLRRFKVDGWYHGNVWYHGNGWYTDNEQLWITMFSNEALKGLTHLQLKNTNFSDKVAVAIGTNLKNLTDLYIFPFVNYYLANKGFRSIITGCNKLSSLEVIRSRSRANVDDILTIPTYLPRLKTLALFKTLKFGGRTWQATLKEKMPDLVIRELV